MKTEIFTTCINEDLTKKILKNTQMRVNMTVNTLFVKTT